MTTDYCISYKITALTMTRLALGYESIRWSNNCLNLDLLSDSR